MGSAKMRKKKNNANNASKNGKSKNEKIKHTAETFDIFARLRMPVPLKLSEIPAVLEKLQQSYDNLLREKAEAEMYLEQEPEQPKIPRGDPGASCAICFRR